MKKEQCGIFPAAGAAARCEPRWAAEGGAFVRAVLYATLRSAHRWRGWRGSGLSFVGEQGASPLPTV